MLSSLVRNAHGSAIRKMFNATVGQSDLINFSVGEPDFITPREIIDIACTELKAGKTHYTPNRGILSLREEISKFHAKEFPCDPAENIIITAGGTEALQLAIFSLVDPGDEVIIFGPSWPNYLGQIQMAGAICRMIPTYEENDFHPDIGDIRAAINTRTKLLIINSPCNPTGAVLSKETLRQIADIILEYNLYAIVDEVYRNIIYGNIEFVSMYSFNDVRDRLVFVNSFSKMFAMTGWRVGYAISNASVINGMTLLHESGVSCLSEPYQLAAEYALQNSLHRCSAMRDEYRERRDIAHAMLNQIDGISCVMPKGAFYFFVNISKFGLSSEEFCMKLLESQRVVTVPGSGFGACGEGYFRMIFAASMDKLHCGIERISTFVKEIS